jgi:hypothetical protein
MTFLAARDETVDAFGAGGRTAEGLLTQPVEAGMFDFGVSEEQRNEIGQ